MKSFFPLVSKHVITWLVFFILVALACSLPANVPTLTPAPSVYPTYTEYPTYTPESPTDPTPANPNLPQPTAQKPKPDAPTATLQMGVWIGVTLQADTEVPPPSGSGSWGITKSDIEVLSVYPTSLTSPGKICIDIRNNGPSEFDGSFQVVCQGTSLTKYQPVQQIPVGYSESIHNTIGVGTGSFCTNLTVDPTLYTYPGIQCIVGVPDNKDPVPDNNTSVAVIP